MHRKPANKPIAQKPYIETHKTEPSLGLYRKSKGLPKKKSESYLQSKNILIEVDSNSYKETKNRVNLLIKREYWENFITDKEDDLYGVQPKIWKMLQSRQ